jgi:hypothetical protein
MLRVAGILPEPQIPGKKEIGPRTARADLNFLPTKGA